LAGNVVSIANSKKHYTNSERNLRQEAETLLTRKIIKLRPPDTVKSNLIALKYWKETIKRMRGISLLDDLDTDMLAAYCIQSAIRDDLRRKYMEGYDTIALMQAQERLILSYANKLGLTAESRMRLAKKRAEEKTIDAESEMFGD